MVIYGDPSYKIKATTNSLINFAVQAALAIRGFGYEGNLYIKRNKTSIS